MSSCYVGLSPKNPTVKEGPRFRKSFLHPFYIYCPWDYCPRAGGRSCSYVRTYLYASCVYIKGVRSRIVHLEALSYTTGLGIIAVFGWSRFYFVFMHCPRVKLNKDSWRRRPDNIVSRVLEKGIACFSDNMKQLPQNKVAAHPAKTEMESSLVHLNIHYKHRTQYRPLRNTVIAFNQINITFFYFDSLMLVWKIVSKKLIRRSSETYLKKFFYQYSFIYRIKSSC